MVKVLGDLERTGLAVRSAALLDRHGAALLERHSQLDPEKLKARHDAQVKGVLDRGTFGLIVLGGSHDLSDSVRKLGQGKCDYGRVTTRLFKEFSE